MTKQTTGLPALTPMPKCVNSASRYFVTITGIIVHGVGFICCESTDAQSGGANLNIECIDRCLRFLQTHGYRFAAKLFVQADNHTDNKTPAVLVYLANLVRSQIFLKTSMGSRVGLFSALRNERRIALSSLPGLIISDVFLFSMAESLENFPSTSAWP
jgi:hypothetical protein